MNKNPPQNLPRPADVESPLRDRIAYAIAQADGDLPGMTPDSWDYKLADAVIAALGCHSQMTRQEMLTMTDLRDRIAAAIKARWRDMSMEQTWDEGTLLLADAVIAALGLRQERVELLTRYVTEWQADA